MVNLSRDFVEQGLNVNLVFVNDENKTDLAGCGSYLCWHYGWVCW